MSTQGRKLLIQREGVRYRPYLDSVGVLTIGVGHTSAAGPPRVTPDLTLSTAEAEEILTRDLAKFEKVINDALKVSVAQNEFDALVSICFNVGPRFSQSTCIKKLNAGDRAGAAEAIMLWNKPSEIIGRRRGEYKQFKTPYRGLVEPKKPSKTTGPVIATTAGTGAGAAAQQAGLPMWAVLLIAVGVAALAFMIWKFRK